VFGPANTNVTKRILDITCSLTTNQTLYEAREGKMGVKPLTWHSLWNDGLFKICAAQANCGIGRLPIIFNDGWCWLDQGQEAMKPCEAAEESFGTGSPLPMTARTLFTWNARFSQYPDTCVDSSKRTITGAVRRRVNELLAQGLDMRGRDLFPGPAYAS